MGMAGLATAAGGAPASGGNTPSTFDGASPDHAGAATVAITRKAIPRTPMGRMTRFPIPIPTQNSTDGFRATGPNPNHVTCQTVNGTPVFPRRGEKCLSD
jgi:hypothetical protein